MTISFSSSNPGSGGFNIGPVGNINGRVVGLRAFTRVASDIAPVIAERAYLRAKGGKNFNDQPVSPTAGSDTGQPVKDISWMPER